MSQENIELLRHSLAAFNQRDFDRWAELADPDVEFIPPAESPDHGVLRGTAAVRDYVAEFMALWDDFTVTTKELIDADPHVVVVARISGTGAESGAKTEMPLIYVCTFRGGRIIRNQSFLERSDALEAAGLSE